MPSNSNWESVRANSLTLTSNKSRGLIRLDKDDQYLQELNMIQQIIATHKCTNSECQMPNLEKLGPKYVRNMISPSNAKFRQVQF